LGDSILAHVNFKDTIENSRHGNPNPNRIPSPDMTLISSKIETGDLNSPLENLLQVQFEISVLLIFTIILISLLLFYIFISYKTKNKLYNIKFKEIENNSFTPVSTSSSVIDVGEEKDNTNKNIYRHMRKIKDLFKKLFYINYELNKKFILSLLIFDFLVLIFLLLMNLYVSYELMIKIEEYIGEYLYLHK
jgi:hypothetical protein